MSDLHADAAAEAVQHLKDAEAALKSAFDHPHHSPRLDNVSSHLRNIISIIEHMPEEEESIRAYAAVLLAKHDNRTIESADRLPDHANRLLDQELTLRAQKASV